jgi:hypothetical protein
MCFSTIGTALRQFSGPKLCFEIRLTVGEFSTSVAISQDKHEALNFSCSYSDSTDVLKRYGRIAAIIDNTVFVWSNNSSQNICFWLGNPIFYQCIRTRSLSSFPVSTFHKDIWIPSGGRWIKWFPTEIHKTSCRLVCPLAKPKEAVRVTADDKHTGLKLKGRVQRTWLPVLSPRTEPLADCATSYQIKSGCRCASTYLIIMNNLDTLV